MSVNSWSTCVVVNFIYLFFTHANHPMCYIICLCMSVCMQSLGSHNTACFCFISVHKFGRFKNPFETITNLPGLYFRFRRFILLLQTKKVISMNYHSTTSSWKPWRWVRLELILTLRDIFINSNLNPITKFIRSSRSTEFKDILPWTSLKWSWRLSQSAQE